MVYMGKNYKENIVSYKIWFERMVEIKLKIENKVLTVLGVYAPEEGREESDDFYIGLQKSVQRYDEGKKKVIVVGNRNTRVGNKKIAN